MDPLTYNNNVLICHCVCNNRNCVHCNYKMINQLLTFTAGIIAGFVMNLLVISIKKIIIYCYDIKNDLEMFNRKMKNYNDKENILYDICDDEIPIFMHDSTNNQKNNIQKQKSPTVLTAINTKCSLPKAKDQSLPIKNHFKPAGEINWFETVEPLPINTYRPISENTIGSMHKNTIRDIRGNQMSECPKFDVSSWLQSTIEPDRSMRGLCF